MDESPPHPYLLKRMGQISPPHPLPDINFPTSSSGNLSKIKDFKELQRIIAKYHSVAFYYKQRMEATPKKMEKRIFMCFKHRIGVLNSLDLSKSIILQSVFYEKIYRILCTNSRLYLGEVQGAMARLLYLLQADPEFLIQLLLKINSNPIVIPDRRDDFVESVTLMFYEDFISNEHGLIKILYLFRALVEKAYSVTPEKKSIWLINKIQILKPFIKSFLSRIEIGQYAKHLFSEIIPMIQDTIQLLQKESKNGSGRTSPTSPTIRAQSPSVHTQTVYSPNNAQHPIKMLTRPSDEGKFSEAAFDFLIKRQTSQDKAKTMRDSIHFANKTQQHSHIVILGLCEEIWRIIQKGFSLLPHSFRFLAKILIDISKKYIPKFDKNSQRALLADLLVKWWIPILLRPELFGVLASCIIEDLHYTQNSTKISNILKNLLSGKKYENSTHFAELNNAFIDENQESVKRYMNNLIDLPIPDLSKAFETVQLKDSNPLKIKNICISLRNLKLIYQAINSSLAEFSVKYHFLPNIIKRIEYYIEKKDIFNPYTGNFKYALDEDTPNLSEKEFELAHKYILFQDIEIKQKDQIEDMGNLNHQLNQNTWKDALESVLLNINLEHWYTTEENVAADLFKQLREQPWLFGTGTKWDITLKLYSEHLQEFFITNYKNQKGLLKELESSYIKREKYILKEMGNSESNILALANQLKLLSQEYIDMIQEIKNDSIVRIKAKHFIKTFNSKFIIVEEIVKGKKQFRLMDMKKGGDSDHRTKSAFPEKIDEFVNIYGGIPEVKDMITKGTDTYKLGCVYKDYQELILNKISENTQPSESENESLYVEIEKYITRKLYARVFPSYPSQEDEELYNKMKCLQWITPIQLGIKPSDINESFWKLAIKAFNKIDEMKSPSEKLECIVECYTIITEILVRFSSRKEAPGADDSLPIFIYIILRACPPTIYTNLNFIVSFRHPSKMLSQAGYCCTQAHLSARFIQELDAQVIGLDQNEFEMRMYDEAEKNNILRHFKKGWDTGLGEMRHTMADSFVGVREYRNQFKIYPKRILSTTKSLNLEQIGKEGSHKEKSNSPKEERKEDKGDDDSESEFVLYE